MVNNAGVSSRMHRSFLDDDLADFHRVMSVNVLGVMAGTRDAARQMATSGGGSIINMSSIVALKALPGRDCYTSAKGAIAALTRSMAVEYAAHKIRVNAIAPGVVLTERVKKLLEGSKDIEKLAATHLLGLGLPSHMADTAVYLASDESAITTGQILSVDSGATVV
jgi:NAD(P)-dependent dehydrogenase (short-subunit alcohol dehydrogenase family)